MASSETDPSLEPQTTDDLLNCINQTVDEAIARNGWAELQASDLSEAELEQACQMDGLEHDAQTWLFTRFLAMATNFSSANFTERLCEVSDLVMSITNLLEEMRREVAQFADVGNEFEELVQVFGNLALDTQHKMGMVLPHMCEASDHIGVLDDVFRSNGNTLFTATDQDDVKIAMGGLASGVKQMMELSRASSQKSFQLGERISKMKVEVQMKRETVKDRVSLTNFLSCIGPITVAGALANAIMSMFGGKDFDRVGMLMMAGVTFSPMSAIIYGSLIGGTTVTVIAGLVYCFWTRYQHKALFFLDKICTGLMELANANMFFLDYLNKSEEAAKTLTVQFEQIQRSITSERYRQRNANLCIKALESIEQAIHAIENIRKIDISRWLTSNSLPRFDAPVRALPLPENN